MYKSVAELCKKNPKTYETIVRIFNILHSRNTGFRGLVHSLEKKLAPDEQDKYKKGQSNISFRTHCNKIVINKINEFETNEKNGKPYNRDDFENSVLNEIRILLQDPEKYMVEHTLDDFDDLKFALSGKNIMKYRFYCSCGNAATAFAYVNSTLPDNEKIPYENLMFITTTHWRNLDNGMSGHTIPCVKMADGNFYAVDPQRYINGKVDFIISELKVGNKIYHLLKSEEMAGQPYMITGFTSPDEYGEKYSNFKRFLQEASMVSSGKGKVFLESIVADVNQEEMREILKKYEDNGYLTSDERKQILFKLGKHQMGVKDKQNDINKQYQSVEKEY